MRKIAEKPLFHEGRADPAVTKLQTVCGLPNPVRSDLAAFLGWDHPESIGHCGTSSKAAFSSSQVSSSRGLLGCSGQLRLDSADLSSQPAFQSVFQFNLRAAAVKVVDGLTLLRQRNKTAQRILVPLLLGNELLSQHSLHECGLSGSAKLRQLGESSNAFRAPRSSRRATVPTVLQELELEIQELQHLALILCHEAPLAS